MGRRWIPSAGDVAVWLRKSLCRLENRNVELLIFKTFVSVVLVTLLSGSAIAAGTGQFRGSWHALWWVTKAVLDPDYLDEDPGRFLTAVSFLVVLVGFIAFGSGTVVLMSSLVAQKVESVRRGLSRLPFRKHVVVLNL